MSEAGWGTDKPTVAGWYWWRSLLGDVEVVKIGYVGKVARVYGHGSDGLRLEHQGPGEWIGPITPDAYDAGRRDALTNAYKIALQQRCERGTPWDLACVTIADLIEAQAQGGEHGK